MFLVESPTWVDKTRRTVYASLASPRKQDVFGTWFQKIWGPSQEHCLQNTADSDRFTPWIWKLSMFVFKQVSLWPSSMSSAGNEPNQHNPKIHHEPPWILGRIDHQNMHIGTLWARSRLRRRPAPRCIATSCLALLGISATASKQCIASDLCDCKLWTGNRLPNDHEIITTKVLSHAVPQKKSQKKDFLLLQTSTRMMWEASKLLVTG